MSRVVAFLRGINLGRRRVKMDDLRLHFETMGLDGVATFIASGNVVFDPPGEGEGGGRSMPGLERRLEGHLAERLGFFTDVMVRGLDEVRGMTLDPVVAKAEADGRNVYVTFAKTDLGLEVVPAFRALETPDDEFVVRGREVFWLRNGGLSDSTVKTSRLEAAFGGVANTTRKLTTLRRLVEKFGD